MTALSAMLDELMGKNRNAAPDEKVNDMHWSDDEVLILCFFITFFHHNTWKILFIFSYLHVHVSSKYLSNMYRLKAFWGQFKIKKAMKC